MAARRLAVVGWCAARDDGEYLCSIAATNGQVGGCLHTEVAPILQRNDQVVLYLDFDLQGHQIEANTRRVLEHKARRRINWNRIAITEEQILSNVA